MKLLLPDSCGTLVVSRFRVTLPLVPPPVRSVPAVTPVIVPLPAEKQAHALPFHCSTWLVAQLFTRLRLRFPLAPPPLRPLPDVVVIPVIVPVPGNVCPLANVICPLLAMFSPVSEGLLLPRANSKFKLPDALLVLLPVGSACHRMFWLTAAPAPLLYD